MSASGAHQELRRATSDRSSRGESRAFPGVTTQRPPKYARAALACDKLIYPLAGWLAPVRSTSLAFFLRSMLPVPVPASAFSDPPESTRRRMQQQQLI